MDRIVIIDGNSLINRAYYAMQRPMITKEGIYTQGIYGFLNMLNKIMDDYCPEYITVAFDRKAPTFRHVAYSDYKAGRKMMPPELAMQMPILKDVLHAMSIETLEIDGFEADDIIGTVAREAEENNLQPLIITGDKDALQLCSKVTKVIITKKGITDFDIYDSDKMMERYSMTPKQFIDLKGLMGDQSDNIPGIPGVGEKTGIKLLSQFGSIEEMLLNTSEIANQKLREKVEDNSSLAMMSKKLATINCFVPIEFTLEGLKKKEEKNDELIRLFTKLEFNSFLKKMDFSKVDDSIEPTNYIIEIVSDTLEKLNTLRNKTCFLKVFSDFNHKGRPEIDGIGLCFEDNLFFIPDSNTFTIEEIVHKISELNLSFVGHSLKNEYYSLMNYGLKNIKTGFDTEIAAYLLQPTKSSYEFSQIMSEMLQISITKEDEYFKDKGQMSILEDNNATYIEYLKEYFSGMKLLAQHLELEIKNEELTRVLYEVELPLIEVLASMEINGLYVDIEVLNSIGDYFKDEIQKLEKAIFLIAGEEFNINSTQQLGIILFEKLQLPAGKKTKKGYSTSADVLEKLKDKSPIIDLVLKYRTASKLNSTYVEGLKPLLSKDSRVHAHFQQTVTATGRISCTEPNLQNIPVRDTLGRELRKAYVAGDEDYVLIGADYSQIELRVLAHLSEDAELIDAFRKGKDIHRITAARVMGIVPEDVTSEDRRNAKAVNFGVIYGMSSFGLSEELHISRKAAEKYINDYFEKYSSVKSFMDNSIQNAKITGYTLTMLGRKRYINEINSSNYMVRQLGERLAMNTPIQGSAADIIKIAMNKVYYELKKIKIDAELILQVHDELILRVNKKDTEKAEEFLVKTMENAVSLLVPLTCEANIGKCWYELK